MVTNNTQISSTTPTGQENTMQVCETPPLPGGGEKGTLTAVRAGAAGGCVGLGPRRRLAAPHGPEADAAAGGDGGVVVAGGGLGGRAVPAAAAAAAAAPAPALPLPLLLPGAPAACSAASACSGR